MQPLPTLRLDAVSVRYGKHVALDHIDLSVDGPTSVALVGSNGSGKTTLLKLAAGLLEPTSGTALTDSRRAPAFVTQQSSQRHWLPLTAGEIVAMGRFAGKGLLHRLDPSDRSAIAEAADRLEVGPFMRRQFSELSGGQQQRVLVARALAQGSDVLLLDEPITGLDLASQERILEIIDAEVESGTLVILSTHHLDEARRCARVVLLAGHVVADGTPDEALVAEHLRVAYGGRVITADSGATVILDDHGHPH